MTIKLHFIRTLLARGIKGLGYIILVAFSVQLSCLSINAEVSSPPEVRFWPQGGTYTNFVGIYLKASQARVRYTLDGTEPDEQSTLFSIGGGGLWPSGTNHAFYDNLLDNSGLENYSNDFERDYNAFHASTNFYSIYTNNIHDTILGSLAYESWGDWHYYQPSSSVLTNAGSTTADALGFYHYTITTNQVKEAGSIIDTGMHYVGLGADGLPADEDGDGVPDYLEDANGNGDHDTGETDWEEYDSPNGITSGPGLVVFTPLEK